MEQEAIVEVNSKEIKESTKVESIAKPMVKETVSSVETAIKKTEVKPVPKPIVEQKTAVTKTNPKEVEKPRESIPVAKSVAKEKVVVIKKTEASDQNATKTKVFENESPEVREVRLLLEQLDAYIELKNMGEPTKIALNQINNHVDENLEIEDESCVLVGKKAYDTFFDMLPDSNFRIQELRRLLNDVFDPLVVNLIRLDIIDHWIQEERHQYALDIMDNIMTHNSESLTLSMYCENDPNKKSSPQIELKNKYFLVYHLLDDDKKKEILAKLKKLTKSKNPTTKNIAKDIHKKISGDFWEKN